MNCVRIGIVGLGNMGTLTANFIHAGEIENCVIGAVCDLRGTAAVCENALCGSSSSLYPVSYTHLTLPTKA